MCNAGMQTDTEIIKALGGPARVAELLGYTTYGTQRVFNWLSRGIPAKVKLEHPHLFLRNSAKKRR
jgi:hypothetical protein